MNKFIARTEAQQREMIISAAAALNMDEAAVEKDFWVCWVLKQLFESALKDSIIFKGGTSLSKVYGFIHRFSEDIDLILNWGAFSNATGWNPGQRYGKSERTKMLKALDDWNAVEVAQEILPVVQMCCGNHCKAEVRPHEPGSIFITYPKLWKGSYIRPEIKLEIGPKAAWNPFEERTIKPYVAERFPQLFDGAECRVRATTAERAFWEKVTILHAQVNRVTELPARYARHYYDTVMIARHADVKEKAMADVELLYRVASFKYYFYRAGWAEYPKAQPGSVHLLPHGHILEELRNDYEAMRKEMLPPDAPDLDVILQELQDLEREIISLQPLPLDICQYPTMGMSE